MTVLVVDDEKEIADLVEVYLKNDGFKVKKAYSGSEALRYIEEENFDLAILDVMLPDTDGFSLCKKIRESYKYPVIMLTAKTGFSDRISGLSIGADDYVTKPFNPLELVARAKAQIRRYHQYNETAENSDIIEISGGLEINKALHTCTLYGEKLNLTPLEYGIVLLLAENAGKVVSTKEVFEKVWGEEYLDAGNTIMVHIRRIREKMHERSRDPKFIKTVWGVGYKIEK